MRRPQVVTEFPLNVNIRDPQFTTLSDLDFRIAIANPLFHDLTVELVAPDGRTRLLATTGDFGDGLGVGPGNQIFGTVYDEEANTPFGGRRAAAHRQLQAAVPRRRRRRRRSTPSSTSAISTA